MRALVTGAAGFVGSHLVEALLARGDDVIGVDCFTPYYDYRTKECNLAGSRRHPKYAFVKADLRSIDIVGMLDRVDVVFHQSAQPGVRLSWSDGFDEYVSQNVLVTQRLLEAAVAAHVERVVYASSSSVYGNQPSYPTSEEHLPRPFSPYGVTKLAAEHLCALYAENWDLHTVSLRYFTVYGPRQRPDMSIHRLCEAALAGSVFPRYGDGSQIREFTYVEDIVAGNLAAAEADVAPGTVLNLAGGGEITLNELIALVEDVSGRVVKVEEQPSMAGDAFRNGGAIDRAWAMLRWEPRVKLRDGIAAQMEWHRNVTREGRPGAPS
jgi:nucleoside-diphosphate-sugar epimerase